MKVTFDFRQDEFLQSFKRDSFAKARTQALELEARTKASARWRDETGLARRSINTKVLWRGNTLVIQNRSDVKYARQLEKGFGGKFRLIGPSLRINRKLPLKMAGGR